MIFVPYTVNPYEVTIHAQEKKKKNWKTWTQDSVESKRSQYKCQEILQIMAQMENVLKYY